MNFRFLPAQSFFGRTYSNVSAIGECKNGGQCVINKKNRTSCKACRLRKCLLVGMSKSGSRYGRRSNWFKIHCLLQEQTGLDAPLGANPLSAHLYGNSFTSEDGHETSRTTPESSEPCQSHDVNASSPMTSSSPSSVTSSRDSTHGDDDSQSKENLRLLLTAAERSAPSVVGYLNKNAAGLLTIGKPMKSALHDPPLPHVLATHPFYQLLARGAQPLRSPPVAPPSPDPSAEQEAPMDLSCKPSAVCHFIRADILQTALPDGHHPTPSPTPPHDAAPLDLTTKG